MHDQELADVTSHVLEELCFYCVDLESAAAEPPRRTWASVTFSGNWSGRMFVGIEPRLLHELATNFLGLDESSNEEAEQALLEITNVICGNALPHLESAEAVFNLGSPEVIEAPAEASAPAAVAAAVLDAGRVAVRVMREP